MKHFNNLNRKLANPLNEANLTNQKYIKLLDNLYYIIILNMFTNLFTFN